MSAAEIARRLGVTDRTVRRHLNAGSPTDDAPASPARADVEAA
jgi:predicted transcriptional regulator